ncbi:Protein CBG21788 [Caenorhabditis briggsae]|uniref:ubiquitinyl hydrolase 1 n=1 Tax=Caenorhabditis briggsae TaxID=6238 RepID=A8Y0H4_CAEBR|nr:Protein CBG21788 [Caenorhabditis briggsae]CAP38392.2 Protein CBG21788 [Caenorhabditis briggsae]
MSNIQVTSTSIEKWREAAQKEGVAILNVAQGQDEMKKHLEFSYNLTGLEENEMYKISLGFHPEPNKTKDSKNKAYVESRNKHGPMDFSANFRHARAQRGTGSASKRHGAAFKVPVEHRTHSSRSRCRVGKDTGRKLLAVDKYLLYAEDVIEWKERKQNIDDLKTTVEQCRLDGSNFARECAEKALSLLEDEHLDELKKANTKRRDAVETTIEYAKLLREMWAAKKKNIAPNDFNDAIRMNSDMFECSEQHDCQEFVAFLLDQLHTSMYEANKTLHPPPPAIDPKKEEENHEIEETDEEKAERSWTEYEKQNESLVTQLFTGQLRSHFIAYAKSNEDKWLLLNDCSVRVSSFSKCFNIIFFSGSIRRRSRQQRASSRNIHNCRWIFKGYFARRKVMILNNTWKYKVKIRVQKPGESYVDHDVPEQEFIVVHRTPQPVNNEQRQPQTVVGPVVVVPPIKEFYRLPDTTSNIEVRCTTKEEWKEKGGGEVDEDTIDIESINHPKYAAIILNKFPPENLKFEYEVTGLEEDSEYEMELLFDPSKNSHLRQVILIAFTRHTAETFRIQLLKSGDDEQVDTRVRQVSHRHKAQPGRYWKKSKVNFDKLWFRRGHYFGDAPADAKYDVDLTSSRMYQVKLRIRKEGDEEKTFAIVHQKFVACSRKFKSESQKNKTNADSDADTDTVLFSAFLKILILLIFQWQPTDQIPQKRHGMMPSTSDNSVMSPSDLPKLQALGAFPHTVNPIQPQRMNIGLKSAQSRLGGIPEPFSQQGTGPFFNTQHVNIEQRQPETMPSRSDNFEFSLSPLFELQIANGMLPHIDPEFAYSVAQALHSISNQPQAGQVLTVPPPVNIIQPVVVVKPVEEPPINPEPEQESP